MHHISFSIIPPIKQSSLFTNMLIAFCLISALILSTLIWGFEFSSNNIHGDYGAVIIYKICKGVPYSGDAMAATLDNFVSPFWLVAGQLSRILPSYEVIFFFFILSRILLIAGLALTIKAILGKNASAAHWVLAACLSIFSGFCEHLPLGSDPVMGRYFSQTSLSIGIAMISLALTFLGKYTWSALCLGIAYNVNAMQAQFALGIVLALWISDLFKNGQAVMFPVRRLIQNTGIFLIVASPTIIWIISATSEPSAAQLIGQDLFDFAKFFFPDHYFWNLKSFWEKSQGISIPILLVLVSVVYHLNKATTQTFRLQKQLLITGAVLLGYIIADIIMEHVPSRLYLQLHLFRSDVIGYALVVALLGATLLDSFQRRNSEVLQTATLILITVLLHEFRLGVLLAGIFLIASFFKKHPGRYISLQMTTGLLLLLILALLALRSRWIDFIFILSESVVYLPRVWFRYFPRALCLIPACGILLMFNVQSYHRIQTELRSEENLQNNQVNRIAQLAEMNTPRDSLFLIPPLYTCRGSLQRGVYLAMRDGAAYLWKKGFEIEYIRRLTVLGITYTPGRQFQCQQVYTEFIQNLGVSLPKIKKEGVTHVILPKDLFVNGCPYRTLKNNVFCLLSINDAIKYLHSRPEIGKPWR